LNKNKFDSPYGYDKLVDWRVYTYFTILWSKTFLTDFLIQ
jgi:hypothetical protein